MRSWTTRDQVREAALRLWERGTLLRSAWGADPGRTDLTWPHRLTLQGPTSQEWSERFDEARSWIAGLEGVPLAWREFSHPRLGKNRVPVAVEWVDLEALLAFVRKKEDTARFLTAARQIADRFPALAPWVVEHPHQVLERNDELPRLLEVVDWFVRHPRPGVYLRQVDVPGVHTKFLEAHRALLAAWLDLVLPAPFIDASQKGVGRFSERYGLLTKPRLVRFRPLDTQQPGPRDLAWRLEDWAAWPTPPKRLIITENEINYLSLPAVPGAWAVFGSGYGFDGWADIGWLRTAEVWYWGDLDTHGFAILDQLRASVPQVQSLLMDEATLLSHRDFWGQEDKPVSRVLTRLTRHEQAVYQGLVGDRWAPRLRLEQEHLRFSAVAAGCKLPGQNS